MIINHSLPIKLLRKVGHLFKSSPTKEELLAKKKEEDYKYLINSGVETAFGFVTLIGKPIIICENGGRIILGEGVTLVSESSFNTAGINHPVIIHASGENAIIRIGDNTGLFGTSIVSCSQVFIGNNVMIGANTNIYGTDFHVIDAIGRIKQQSIEEAPSAPIEIKDNCWIASNVTILKGAHIGEETVIGAMSLVNKDIPSKVIAAGVPAKVIRKLK